MLDDFAWHGTLRATFGLNVLRKFSATLRDLKIRFLKFRIGQESAEKCW